MRIHLSTLMVAVVSLLAAATSPLPSQTYFPPVQGDAWESVSPAELGWCVDKIDTLLQYVERNSSKAFIVLKDGRIVMEWYSDGFESTDNWYWASAGKVVTATLVGILVEDGRVEIEKSSQDYIGKGWTSLTPEQEAAITVRHQLTMTTGLDDRGEDPYCTDPECLVYKAEPGTRWAYHNGPYTMLDGVIEGASGASLNTLYNSALAQPIGMNGGYIRSGFNNVLFTTPRSMARFGHLALNDFVWEGKTVLGDKAYIEAMTNTSQDLNLSYGYLWWLNGKASYMLPGLQWVIPNPITPTAPPDAYYGLGKNDQVLCVVPSEQLVVIRMGDAASPDGPAVPTQFASELWALLRDVICTPTSVSTTQQPSRVEEGPYSIFDLHGRLVATGRGAVPAQHLELPSGIYVARNAQSGTIQKLFVP